MRDERKQRDKDERKASIQENTNIIQLEMTANFCLIVHIIPRNGNDMMVM